MKLLRRIRNIVRYGLGDEARARKYEAKRAAKRERFASDRWQHDGVFAQRRYQSYDDYVEHQRSKLGRIEERLRERQDEALAEFEARFRGCPALAGARSVLCLGARLGTEVEALHRLGYFAVGVDLEPGAGNRHVLTGDFHALVFPSGSVDAVYCNALDHVFDFDRMVGEAARVLRPGGVFLAEFEVGYGEGHVPGDFEAMHWSDSDAVVARIADAGKLSVETAQELGETSRGRRRLVAFRKAS